MSRSLIRGDTEKQGYIFGRGRREDWHKSIAIEGHYVWPSAWETYRAHNPVVEMRQHQAVAGTCRVGSVGKRWERSGLPGKVKEGFSQKERLWGPSKVEEMPYFPGTWDPQLSMIWAGQCTSVSQAPLSGGQIKPTCFPGMFRRKRLVTWKINKTLYRYD